MQRQAFITAQIRDEWQVDSVGVTPELQQFTESIPALKCDRQQKNNMLNQIFVSDAPLDGSAGLDYQRSTTT